jgi:hypothetical protein
MGISERQALEQLVSSGVINNEIAEIIQTLARDKATDVTPAEGANYRALVLLLDKSGSMVNLKNAVIEGQHYMINSLLGATTSMTIYFGQILFNHEVEYFQNIGPFRDPSVRNAAHPDTRLLDPHNYKISGGTALYDTIVHGIAMLAPILLMADEMGQQLLANIAIITDGKDEHSKTNPANLKKVVDHVVGMGIIDHIALYGLGSYDYKTIGKSIGIEDVIEPGVDPKEIRSMFGMISSMTIEDRG